MVGPEIVTGVAGLFIGGILTLLGTFLNTRHTTQGARRQQASTTARSEFEIITEKYPDITLGYLVHYHFRLIEFQEGKINLESFKNDMFNFSENDPLLSKMQGTGTV